jgi:hypothetical protein
MSTIVLEVKGYSKVSINGIEQEKYILTLYRDEIIYTTYLFRFPKLIQIIAGAVLNCTEVIDYISYEKVKKILKEVPSHSNKAIDKICSIINHEDSEIKRRIVKSGQLSLFD